MSIFSDLKRVFFGAKSVAKHQASKAEGKVKEVADDASDAASELADATREAARELMDKTPEYVAKGKEALEDLTDKIWREADAAVDKGKELKDQASDAINAKLDDLRPKENASDPFAELDLSPKSPTTSSPPDRDFGELTVSEPPSAAGEKKLIDFESEFLQDAKAKAAGAAAKANEFVTPGLDAAAKAGNKMAEKLGDLSETVGKVVMEKGDDLLNRAAETGATAKDKFDDFVDHANVEAEKIRAAEAAEEARIAAEVAKARDKAFDGAEGARDTSDSILSGTDSFFERADRFAKGDYHDEGGKDMTIKKNPNPEPKPEGGLIAGFLDSDGDGDSLIDDAIIEEE
ncbi:hypothetical protein [Lewinella sp. 4G2]|uniref:hypothetical protein n=1 Tax=Lewinella sp. 4G2 TaxID=1803372 RepID=UPI0007B4994D|nr:hypothetical protein [Lewinella sp. 4G2]OAV44884.1 hypothetical protein A3850_010445 [Lewinella sp. 4G2]